MQRDVECSTTASRCASNCPHIVARVPHCRGVWVIPLWADFLSWYDLLYVSLEMSNHQLTVYHILAAGLPRLTEERGSRVEDNTRFAGSLARVYRILSSTTVPGTRARLKGWQNAKTAVGASAVARNIPRTSNRRPKTAKIPPGRGQAGSTWVIRFASSQR